MIRLQERLGRTKLISATILTFSVAALYSLTAYALEFWISLHPVIILGLIFGLAFGGVEMFLRLRYSKEMFRIAQGRDERSLPQDLFVTIPISLAVCVRLGNYSLYSVVFVAALIIIWVTTALSFSD